jgi:uncharacterized protein (DUF1330 family)
MTAYVIYQGVVTDPARYEDYKVAAAASIAAAGGRYVVRGGEMKVLEGDEPPGRTVVLEFPSVDDALAWYQGDGYTAARALRAGAAEARMYVVDGVPEGA